MPNNFQILVSLSLPSICLRLHAIQFAASGSQFGFCCAPGPKFYHLKESPSAIQTVINMEDYGVIFIQLFEGDTFGYNINTNLQRKVAIFRRCGAPCISVP